MTSELIEKIIKGRPVHSHAQEQDMLYLISDDDLVKELFEICDTEHSSCTDNCPVYKANGSKVPWGPDMDGEGETCTCFKSGKAMLDFLKNRLL